MTDRESVSLCDPVLIACGIDHGFGQRGSQPPDSTIFPNQVHGTEVFEAGLSGVGARREKADIILGREAGICVGIVTADCVPILVSTVEGSVVAAIHAGWRGLAAGVIEAGLQAIRSRAEEAVPLVAAVGPAAGSCCYEVDQPVREGLSRSYEEILGSFLRPGRPDHFQLDLPALAIEILGRNGVEKHRIGVQNCICTICSGSRFESYRRDGSAAGRMKHYISRSGTSAGQG